MPNGIYQLSLSLPIPRGMKVPDFGSILEAQIRELVVKYPYYKDTWLNTEMNLSDGTRISYPAYYKYRIQNETNELLTAKTKMELIRKHVNLLNLTAMSLHRLLNE